MKSAKDIKPGDLLLEPSTGIWRKVRNVGEMDGHIVIAYEPQDGCSCGGRFDKERSMNVRKKK